MAATISNLAQLLRSTPDSLGAYDIGLVNLLCATGLPGAEGLDIRGCLATLDHWASMVKRYVRDARREYQLQPERYERKEGFFSFLSMVTLLKHERGLGIAYQPTAIGNYDYSDSRDDLLHGILTRRLGTCTSLPVLFVTIGRRLGWPMHLAVAKRHVFCQWINDDGTRLNLEGSSAGGGELMSDKDLMEKPHRLMKRELESGLYLRPLGRHEELALFLETRGHCLVDNGRFEEARKAYGEAYRWAPKWSQHANHVHALEAIERQGASVTLSKQRVATRVVPWGWHEAVSHHGSARALSPEVAWFPRS